MRDIAVIGAGMAGCTLARRLVDAGLNVQVFDKGRAAGGRMATRRADRLQFDHGVQYMTVRGEAMAAQLADWRRAGVAAAWAPVGLDASSRWVGVPGMNAIAPRMLWGAELHMETAITGFGRDHHGWWLETAQDRLPACFDAVLVTLPAPQAAALFGRCTDVDVAAFADAMARIRYAPCWVLMLVFDTRLDASDCLRPAAGGVLGWAARDSSKPQRDTASDCWVIHADPTWSQQHLELTVEQVQPLLLDAFLSAVGATTAPSLCRAHRWRFARVVEALGRECVWDADRKIGYASDGCLGERVEDAFDSANALADRVLLDDGSTQHAEEE